MRLMRLSRGRPVTAPEPEVEVVAGGECDVSTLFEARQLRGRQVSWEAVRFALAELARPSTLAELRETMWRQYTEYVSLVVGLGGVKKTERFDSLVEGLVRSCLAAGKVQVARVGGTEQEDFVWLESEEWPSARDRQVWRSYRTVHQVRPPTCMGC